MVRMLSTEGQFGQPVGLSADGFDLAEVRSRCRASAERRAPEPNEELVTLADAVIHRLLLVGLATQSLLSHIDDPTVAARADPILDGLDATINEIRSTVFDEARRARPDRL